MYILVIVFYVHFGARNDEESDVTQHCIYEDGESRVIDVASTSAPPLLLGVSQIARRDRGESVWKAEGRSARVQYGGRGATDV